MLLLNTRFAVTPDLDRPSFISMFRLWVQSSTYASCDVPENVLEQPEYVTESGSEEDKRKISIFSLDDLLGVVVESKDKGDNWKLTYGFHDKEEKPYITVTLDKTGMKFGSQDTFNLPGFLKQLFWNEYGGDDEGLITDNRAVILRKAQIPEYKQDKFLFKERFNPIVYVSCKKDGSYKIDYDGLAVELMGQAHVIVESSPAVAGMITDFWKKKPVNGDCTIILPTGETQDISVADDKSFLPIVETVRDCLVRGVSYVFDPVSLQTRSISAKLASEDKELAALFDDILDQKDSEIKSLKAEIEKLKEDNFKASSKADALQGTFESSNSESSANAISFEGDEKDFYTNERKDIILKVLKKELDSISGDANTGASRKADVLRDVLEHNFPSGTDAELTAALKGAFNDGTLTKGGIGRLQSLGFKLIKEKNNHTRILYNGDPRYASVIASTSSDYRQVENFVSDFTKVCFK